MSARRTGRPGEHLMITTTKPAAGVMLIAIDGQRRRNALDLEGFRALAAAWRALEASDEARVGVVTGNGTDFCSGADLSSIGADMAAAARRGDPGAGIWGDVHAAVLRGVALTKPVVSAVEGVCFGAGMELVGASDIRIAGESARFALPEVRHGVIASGGSLARLARQIAYGPATRRPRSARPSGRSPPGWPPTSRGPTRSRTGSPVRPCSARRRPRGPGR